MSVVRAGWRDSYGARMADRGTPMDRPYPYLS